jgi:hypothetical protein
LVRPFASKKRLERVPYGRFAPLWNLRRADNQINIDAANYDDWFQEILPRRELVK